jgi:hypothetical protein
VGLQGAAVVLMSRCVTLTEAGKVWIEVLAPVCVFWENFGSNVNEGFGVVILSDGAGHLEGAVCDKSGKALNREYEIRARLILVTRKVMALEDETLCRSSKSLGFCDCEVIDQVGVLPAGPS